MSVCVWDYNCVCFFLLFIGCIQAYLMKLILPYHMLCVQRWSNSTVCTSVREFIPLCLQEMCAPDVTVKMGVAVLLVHVLVMRIVWCSGWLQYVLVRFTFARNVSRYVWHSQLWPFDIFSVENHSLANIPVSDGNFWLFLLVFVRAPLQFGSNCSRNFDSFPNLAKIQLWPKF